MESESKFSVVTQSFQLPTRSLIALSLHHSLHQATDSTGKEGLKENDPMLWWRLNAHHYPVLQLPAKHCLGPPPGNAEMYCFKSICYCATPPPATQKMSSKRWIIVFNKTIFFNFFVTTYLTFNFCNFHFYFCLENDRQLAL
jgi:hypothetical protein